MGTKEQVVWEELKKQTLIMIEGQEKAMIVNLGILDLCNSKIAVEEKKLQT
jgi:hypothetical protein